VISTLPIPKQTILCVDNDEVMLRYEKALLERSGYAVLSAVSAEQALRLVIMCKCDAVLLDYEMPVMNGYEVASEIKRLRPELIVIMVSGSEVPVSALTKVDAFVPKLEATRELLPMIAELCGRNREAQHKGGKQQQDRQQST
jgi:CheY-like chemotaxis protein